MTFELHDGRLLRDGTPFTAVGVTYHPSEAGCLIWRDWDPEAVAEDFRLMAADGLNTVRVFLFWRDFQPTEDALAEPVLDRLDHLLSTAARHGLVCVLSLLTIWMNGQLLDLPWRRGRGLWRDDAVRAASLRYARAVARVAARHGCVLAYDLGDEVWHVDPAQAAALSRDEVAEWQRELAGAIRELDPPALVLQANEASAVFGGGPVGVDNQAGLDLIGIHGFPTWAPGSIESTASYKATALTPFLVRVAAAHGPVLVDELGSYGVDEATAAGYLGASAASALAHGAAGVLAWCWQDIASTAEPYRDRPAERFSGLRRLDGAGKPALAALKRVAAARVGLSAGRPRAATALYLPERLRGGGGSYLDAAGSPIAAWYAALLLTRAHLDFDVTRDDLDGRALVVCAAPAQLTLPDLERLRDAARAGATVYLSLGDHLHGFAGEELTGVEPVDFRALDAAVDKASFRWGEHQWPVDWAAAGRAPVAVRATTATVLAHYADGTPAVTENRVGAGRVVFAAMPFEPQLDRPGRLASADWPRFYHLLADRAEVVREVSCDHADVEVVVLRGGSALVVNHADREVEAVLARRGRTTSVRLRAKDWELVEGLGGT